MLFSALQFPHPCQLSSYEFSAVVSAKHQNISSPVSSVLRWGGIYSEPVRSLSLMLCCQAPVSGQHHSATLQTSYYCQCYDSHFVSLPTKAVITFLAPHQYLFLVISCHCTYFIPILEKQMYHYLNSGLKCRLEKLTIVNRSISSKIIIPSHIVLNGYWQAYCQ